MLKFGYGNGKLAKYIATFSLPAGYSCPGAEKCLAMANRKTGKITDGSKQEFRCFSASTENLFPSVRKSRWNNFEQLKMCKNENEIFNLLFESVNANPTLVYRVHVSGDFFSQEYFNAWMRVAAKFPERTFYAYTKSIHFWKSAKNLVPKNFILNASLGGKYDNQTSGLKTVLVVSSEAEVKEKNLNIDHDDSLAYKSKKSFALLLHGQGRPGSVQARLHREHRIKK